MPDSSGGLPQVAALLVALSLGGLGFLHLVVLPTALLRLPAESLERLRQSLLAVFYRVCGGLNLLAALLVSQRVEALWLGLVAVLFAIVDFVLRPQIGFLRQAGRQGDASAEVPLRRMQRRSLGITMLQTAIGATVFFRLVTIP